MRKDQPRPEPVTSSAVVLPSEGFGREPISADELEALSRLVTDMTVQAMVAPDVMDQRRALFAIGDELKKERPAPEQAREALSKMQGFALELAGRKIVVDSFIDRGSFGAVFKVHEEGPPPWKDMVLKVSLPFDRTAMFAASGATAKEVTRAEMCRNLIMEVAALDTLTKEVVGVDPETGKKTYRRMIRHGGIPSVPILIAAQFIPEPSIPGQPAGDRKSPDRRIAAILMEEITGQSLDTINQRWDIGRDSPHLIRLGLQLATGLKYIHDRGVFHSDIKLKDIKINPNQDPIFMDLGSATVAEISTRHATSKSDRVNYGRVDAIFAARDYVTALEGPSAERDIYALGMVMSKLIYGQNFKRAGDRVGVISQLSPASQQVAELVSRMTLRLPKSRPTLDQIIETLQLLQTL